MEVSFINNITFILLLLNTLNQTVSLSTGKQTQARNAIYFRLDTNG